MKFLGLIKRVLEKLTLTYGMQEGQKEIVSNLPNKLTSVNE